MCILINFILLCTQSLRLRKLDNISPFNVTEWEALVAEAIQFHTLADNQNEGGEQNLCINDHAAPEFFLLGAQKAGTTSFSAMLAHPSIVYPMILAGEPAYYRKELHIFDSDDRFKQGSKFWLSHYPKCNTATRIIAADFTPNYLWSDPHRIATFYGEKAHRLKFAVILRNPVSRIQSAFHFYQGKGWCGNQEYLKNGFKAYIQKLLNGFDPCRFIELSDYAQQLRGFVQIFDSSQFTVFPFLEVVSQQDGLCRAAVAVWKSLGIFGKIPKMVHANLTPHPSVEQELDSTLLNKFQSYVEEHIGADHIAEVITDHRINIYGYKSEVDTVSEFLRRSW